MFITFFFFLNFALRAETCLLWVRTHTPLDYSSWSLVYMLSNEFVSNPRLQVMLPCTWRKSLYSVVIMICFLVLCSVAKVGCCCCCCWESSGSQLRPSVLFTLFLPACWCLSFHEQALSCRILLWNTLLLVLKLGNNLQNSAAALTSVFTKSALPFGNSLC